MKVILRENVKTLGNVGEIVNVSPGYARNFLIPNNSAVVADERNTHILEEEMKRLSKKIEAEKSVATEIQKKLNGLQLEVEKRVGANGKLFGAITTNDISKLLADKGIEVEKRLLQLDRPVKSVGNYELKAKLFKDIEAEFTLKVVMDAKSAEELKKKQAEAEKKASKKKEEAAETTEENQEETV